MKYEDNELLCRVGPGTPMASLIRRYWQPVLLSSDLPEPDCPPKRFQFCGERYVAFRNSEGKIGILDEGCCHRGASLALGRVEGGGIRCILHGWKFDIDGKIHEMPNADDPRIMERYRANAYPAREAGDLIWMYGGPRDKQPPFRDFEYLRVPSPQRVIVRIDIACNFVHVMEGSLDSSHVGILHVDRERKQAKANAVDKSQHLVQSFSLTAPPRLEVRETEFGLDYAALRTLDGASDAVLARITPFIMPNMFMIPPGNFVIHMTPYDDTHTGWLLIYWDRNKPIDRAALLERTGLTQPGTWANDQFLRNWSDNFGQDREAMVRDSWAGLTGITVEDGVIQLSQGEILDRTKENLIPADIAIVRARRMLLENIQRVAAGRDPVGIAPTNAREICSAEQQIARGGSWHSIVPGHRPAAARAAVSEPAE